jgi:aspartyl-tRNA(Asn)/glutamyl-tRNA(Gln) amidotransferase subunit C
MKITREEVEYVAQLGRIELTGDEALRFTSQLGQILSYFEKLTEADTAGIEPTRHAIDLANAFRADQVKPSYDSATALANAPDREGPFFKVPKIIE